MMLGGRRADARQETGAAGRAVNRSPAGVQHRQIGNPPRVLTFPAPEPLPTGSTMPPACSSTQRRKHSSGPAAGLARLPAALFDGLAGGRGGGAGLFRGGGRAARRAQHRVRAGGRFGLVRPGLLRQQDARNAAPGSFRPAGGAFYRRLCRLAVCSPTRASLMTGKCPARLHMTIWAEAAADPPRNRRLLPPVAVANLPHSGRPSPSAASRRLPHGPGGQVAPGRLRRTTRKHTASTSTSAAPIGARRRPFSIPIAAARVRQ